MGPSSTADEQRRAGMIEAHIDSLLRQRLETLERAGKDGTKVVGYLPGGYVPEELIYASGAIPLCLATGGDGRVADEALSLVPSVICAFARAQIAQLMRQTDPFYSAIDLLVVPSTCQHMKKIGDVWEFQEGRQVFKLGVPYEHDKAFELEYYRDRLCSLKERLETLTGNHITDGGLIEAAETYNHLRRLLRTLGQTRRNAHQGNEAINTLEFARLDHASFFADPVAMTASLEEICADFPSSADPSAGIPDPSLPRRPRLLLVGPNLAVGDYDLLKMVVDAGADIVVEDIFEGMRDCRQVVDLSGHQDCMEALARAYLIDKRPAAFMRGSLPLRLEHLHRLAREYAVSGVIWYQLLCCEFYDEESCYFQMMLQERGIPMLVVESDYHALDSGQLRTRLAAFIETIQGGPIDA